MTTVCPGMLYLDLKDEVPLFDIFRYYSALASCDVLISLLISPMFGQPLFAVAIC